MSASPGSSFFGKLKNHLATFRALPPAEKKWVLRHPVAALKAHPVKQYVEHIIRQKYENQELDGTLSDGQLDALRHSLWMALTARRIGTEKARSLGEAHEAGNKENALKQQKEHGSVADKASTDMDLRNNEAGLAVARQYPKAPVKKLLQVLQQKIEAGEMWIIKQDTQGRFLDWEGYVIPKEKHERTWRSPRCIVPSNYNLNKTETEATNYQN